jgi:hypothetical protein
LILRKGIKMKKKALMSLVLLAIIGTSAVFAQTPTLDKLNLVVTGQTYRAERANTSISGAIVIPDTHNGRQVTQVGGFNDTAITSIIIPEGVTTFGPSANAFWNCKELVSVTIPASMTQIGPSVFGGNNNPKLTSVTFGGSNTKILSAGGFPGDLAVAYQAGGAGTYTRREGSNNWTKVGGFSLNGVWTRADGMKITIADNGANLVITGDKPNNEGKLNDTYTKR